MMVHTLSELRVSLFFIKVSVVILFLLLTSIIGPSVLFNTQLSKPMNTTVEEGPNENANLLERNFRGVLGSSKTVETSTSPAAEQVAEITSSMEQSNNVTADMRDITSNYNSLPLHTTYRRPEMIYGNIHMAKTGGTYLNGYLANNFERVCGHKGYSYDAYQANEKFMKKTKDQPNLKRLSGSEFSRDRVRFETMDEIGYEDCDFVSNEKRWNFWLQFNHFHNTPMELHLPCRKPVDHLMSQCNFRGIMFNCQQHTNEENDDELLAKSIQACLIQTFRFDYKLTELDNIYLKCYDFQHQFTTYMDYISDKLQPRRFISDYQKRETNRPRRKENECIWKDEVLMQRVKRYLVNNIPYYMFCNQCIGSQNDLTRELA